MRHGRGSSPAASGDRRLKGQESERRCLTRRCSGLASLATELHSLGIARDRLARAGRVRLRSGYSPRPRPLSSSWQSRRAVETRRGFRASPHRVTSSVVCAVYRARQVLSFRSGSVPRCVTANSRVLGRPRPVVPFKQYSDILSDHRGGPQAERGPRNPEPLSHVFRVAGPTRHGRGSGKVVSGDRGHRGQQSERRCLTRRCSGLASLAAELHSLGLARGAYTNYGTPASVQSCRAVPVPSHCLWQVSSEVSGSASWSPWRRRTASRL